MYFSTTRPLARDSVSRLVQYLVKPMLDSQFDLQKCTVVVLGHLAGHRAETLPAPSRIPRKMETRKRLGTTKIQDGIQQDATEHFSDWNSRDRENSVSK